jgi:hypothetical protein
MKPTPKLSRSMTLRQFDNGYWYATQLKEFAEELGVVAAHRLRKDELEEVIRVFLKTGKLMNPTIKNPPTRGIRDVEKGLSLDLPVAVYTNDPVTKQFIEQQAQEMSPRLKRKSGARYRLNRWRENQMTSGVKLTYRMLVQEYVRLNQSEAPFKRVPHGRYINFMSDFLSAEKSATREQALRAWTQLKSMDIPKDYRSWKKYQRA